jgi:hypothetical protein
MSKNRYLFLLLVLTVTGVLLLWRQHVQIVHAKEALALRQIAAHSAQGTSRHRDLQPSPSSELLKLRNEVTMLNAELKAVIARPIHNAVQAEEEWDEVHSGQALSEKPGFVAVKELLPVGNSTPAEAFQSFHFALRNQQSEPLTPTKMKEIWDVPDDFDDPKVRYSISMGQGIGGETGYLISTERVISSNEVRLSVDFETKDGGSFRQNPVLVYRDGRWRMKPESVTVAN